MPLSGLRTGEWFGRGMPDIHAAIPENITIQPSTPRSPAPSAEIGGHQRAQRATALKRARDLRLAAATESRRTRTTQAASRTHALKLEDELMLEWVGLSRRSHPTPS
jgi:hypothetical protein